MYDQSLSPCHIFSKELLIQCYKSISDFLYNINPSFIKRGYIIEGWKKPKIGCVFLIVVVSMFPMLKSAKMTIGKAHPTLMR